MTSGDGERASDAVRALLRAAHTVRTYPADNQMSRQALEDLAPRLQSALPMDLVLARDQIFWNEIPLLGEDADRSSILSGLYRDGVRRLQFREGMDRQQIDRLVVAFATPLDPEDLSEDFVTRLWEADLPHLGVVALDPYLDVDVPEDVLEGKERPTAESEEVGAREPDPNVPPPPDEAFEISERDAARIAQMIADESEVSPWPTFVRALFEAADSPVAKRRIDDLVFIVEACFQRLLTERQLGTARMLMESIRSHCPDFAVQAFRQAIGRMTHPKRLAPLAQMVEEGSCDLEEMGALFESMLPIAEHALCVFMRDARSGHARRFYAESLEKIGPPVVPMALQIFGKGGPELDLLLARMFGRLRDERVVEPLLDALPRVELSSRREFIRALAMIRGQRALAALLDIALTDDDATCRVLALRGLGGERAQIDGGRVLARIRSRGFGALGDEEKNLLFRALGATASDDAVPVLAGMLRAGWIPRGRDERNDARVVSALRSIASDTAVEALRSCSRSWRGSIRRLCTEALEGMGR